jgi:GTP-binding protein
MQGVVDAHAVWNGRVSTNPLNRWLSDVISRIRRPRSPAAALKLNYITQAKARPPSFVLFCSRADAIPESYQRYLINSLRDTFDLPGTPIRMALREKDNPFAGRAKKKR